MWGREGLALLLTICVAEGKLLLLFSPFSEICIEITYVHEGEQIIISSCSLMNFHKVDMLMYPGTSFETLPASRWSPWRPLLVTPRRGYPVS